MRVVRFGFYFVVQEALCCVFPAVIFLALAVTRHYALPHRYDALLVICLFTQWVMYRSGLETWEELKIIAIFHIVGLCLELYKVHMGSWAYPEEGWSKVWGVPLYSGFMYASVASYICQAWRRMHLEMVRWPSLFVIIPVGVVVYLNFFTHHFIPDLRWWLAVLLICIFWRTRVRFSVAYRRYHMPLTLSFVLIGLFIWIAENIATFFGAWVYPDQAQVWRLVAPEKISSWSLLVIISILIVAQLKRGGWGFSRVGFQVEQEKE